MTFAIRLENLGKHYLLKHESGSNFKYRALSDAIASWGAKAWKKQHTDPDQQRQDEPFWAIRDINLDIKPGDRIGIIGRNGAGKSTLLKILSRITPPTTGRAIIRGRLASLLEVGTGFHPELTGRDNIFLNGAILGMRRAEVASKFDEIVAFAEVERFVDIPVKNYSSGMYVRLAFAVAAHLEPEILIVDEVLAVGDLSFQKKCLGKMEHVGKQGRTVIFVSHNLVAVRNFCTKALLLEQGQQKSFGDVNAVANQYASSIMTRWTARHTSTSRPHIQSIQLCTQQGELSDVFDYKTGCTLRVRVFSAGQRDIAFGFTVFNTDDIGIFSSITTDTYTQLRCKRCELEIEIPIHLLNSGEYRIEGALGDSTTTYEQNDCYASFIYSRSERFDISGGKSKGVLRIESPWRLREVPE